MERLTVSYMRPCVFFSGGLDSSWIAFSLKRLFPSMPLVVVGLKGCLDVQRAEAGARELGMHMEWVELTEDSVRQAVKGIQRVFPSAGKLDFDLGCVEWLACAHARSLGCTHVFSGSGADALFAGFDAFKNALKRSGAEGVQQEIIQRVRAWREKDGARLNAIAHQFSLAPVFPFMEEPFLSAALRVPVREKIRSPSDALRKHALRALAIKEGLPQSLALQSKKAMQYGSGSLKVLARLRRRHVV